MPHARTLILGLSALSLTALAMQPKDKELPQPKVITAGASASEAPSDAIVLFDGTSVDAWQHPDGKPASWKLDATPAKGGAMTMTNAPIITKKKFGDCQLHVEFCTPAEVKGDGQGRGNSGVYFQSRYEVQVLDSYKNETYPDGQCAAIYKQHAPLVNASRKPGEWQTYDIIFHAAKFENGKKTANARLTVFHNGVLVQDNAEVTGPTGSAMNTAEEGDGPLYLQDHGNPVRYRNIWIRPL